MSVEISPAHTLSFPRPLTQLVKRTLLVHNPHSSPVAFKVKTTAPKQYCVRPNSGRIEPGESVEVSVLLQPLAQEPPPHAKCKDKFLVQSAFISPDEEMRTLAEMWSQTEKTNKSAIHEQKVKCAYVAAEDGSTGANGIPEEPEEHAGGSGDQSRMMDESQVYSAAESSPTHQVTNGSSRTPPVAVAAAAPVPAQAETKPIPAASTSVEPPLPPLTANTIAETKGPSPTDAALEKSVTATSTGDDKLQTALAEIDRLRAQLAEATGPVVTGLRKRGGAQAQAGVETAVEKTKEVVAAAQGIPIEIVGGLVLAVFVLTYLFF